MMKKIKFDKMKNLKKTNNSDMSDKRSKLAKIINSKNSCILCQKNIRLKQMPNLIQKALTKKHNEYKLKEYVHIIDDILEEKNTTNYYNFIEINMYCMNENVFRKVFPITKFKKKMDYLWKIYQFVLFVPRFFQKRFFKSLNKYYNSIKKVRDKFLHELIKKMDEEEILKLKIDIKNIFKLKPKDIIVENNPNEIKNKFLNFTVVDNYKVVKNNEIKFSIKNIINSFKDKKLRNNQNDLNMSSGLLDDLRNNFKNSLSEILNNTIFKNKNLNKEYSKLSFLNSVIIGEVDNKNKKEKLIDTKRNFKKKKDKTNLIKNDKTKNKNYSIKKVNKNEIKKIKIINNININSNSQYNNIFKDLKFPLKSININNKVDKLIKTTTNRVLKNNGGIKTNRDFVKKKKSINRINNNKKEKKEKKYKTLKSYSNIKNLKNNFDLKNKFIGKSNTNKDIVKNKIKKKISNNNNKISNNKYKINKSIGNKKLVLKKSDTNQLLKEKYLKNQFHTVKYKSFKNKFISSPIKISINKDNFEKIKKKITKNLFKNN